MERLFIAPIDEYGSLLIRENAFGKEGFNENKQERIVIFRSKEEHLAYECSREIFEVLKDSPDARTHIAFIHETKKGNFVREVVTPLKSALTHQVKTLLRMAQS